MYNLFPKPKELLSCPKNNCKFVKGLYLIESTVKCKVALQFRKIGILQFA